ncbi:dual specificity protein kinase YAK1 [Iris pallida]|uniref:Dual specificity protein kinase YAK1 n=1 Tax=Iris pallida TaxID=29817 RepID=A0AAX6E6L7_IRIPA|nr:dual specificity protein kinase YAK1 [Iris pallida]
MVEGGGSSRDGGGKGGMGWGPRAGGAFRLYSPSASVAMGKPESSSSAKSSTLRVVVRRPLVVRLTKDIVETFQLCNPNFKYTEALNPKRFLTNPSVGVANDGYDNSNSDLILHMNSVLVNVDTKQRYYVKDILGQGTFGQVAKCWVSETDSYVAVKVIKNNLAYHRQALVEFSILTMLNEKLGNDEKRHIVRILDCFVYQKHLCISFEMLGSNLYELIKMNHYRGFPLSIVQVFSKQILQALVVIKEVGIIHCDLKPENILLSTSTKPEIKVIDFGSACMEGRTIYSYIQSRYYRSPEVVVGYPYTTAIDMWSFGCIVAELFLGLPLFPGASELDLLKRMIEILGGQPPDYLLREAKYIDKFFMPVGSIYRLEDNEACKGRNAYRILTEEEYEKRRSEKPMIGKRYFNHVKLEDIVTTYPYRKNLPEEEISREKSDRLALVDFLRGLLEFDPVKRWSPMQASRHPFVTGEAFTCPFKPPPETPRIPVMHSVTIEHNPGGGHWVAAGLSPQVPNASQRIPHNSPHFQMVPLSHGTNFGSLGSYGSYNDNTGPGSSYGSYGDINNMHSYFSPAGGPCGINIHRQVGGSFLGVSPDARRRPQVSHGNGFGVSPTGSLGPMSLGASPSQFTPPSSQMQMPNVSPGKYGPTSPARGSVHGSPLGKAPVIGQYNRRRSWGYPVASSMQPHENPSQQWQGHHSDSISCSHPEAYSRGHFGSPRSTLSISNQSNWRQRMGPTSTSQNLPASTVFHSNMGSSHSAEVSSDKLENSPSLPDPADWDPNYSDDQLLQEDGFEVNSLASGIANNLRLGKAIDSSLPSGAGKGSHSHSRALASSTFVSSNRRTDGQYQAYPHTEYNPQSAYDMHAGYSRLPPLSQNSPSRFGQQPILRYNHNSNYMRGEQIYLRGQPTRSNYAEADSHSSANEVFGSGMSWGRRGGQQPIPTTIPSSQGRKDYGSLS